MKVAVRILTKQGLEEAFAEGVTEREDLAARFGVHPDSVRRAMRHFKMVEPLPRAKWTPAMAKRVRELLADGLPLTWIADDIGVARGLLVKRGIRQNPAEVAAWHSVWPSILRNPRELELHREFAPKSKVHPVEDALPSAA